MTPNIFWIEHKILKNSYGVLACVLLRARETGKKARGEFPLELGKWTQMVKNVWEVWWGKNGVV